jgi:hypothetical protein
MLPEPAVTDIQEQNLVLKPLTHDRRQQDPEPSFGTPQATVSAIEDVEMVAGCLCGWEGRAIRRL